MNAPQAALLAFTTLLLGACGQQATPQVNTTTPEISASDQKIIADIQREIASGTLKPSIVISQDSDVNPQDITANDGTSCYIYNVVDYSSGQAFVGGHVYMQCTKAVTYMQLSGFLQNASRGQSSPNTRDERYGATQLLVYVAPLSWYNGNQYCTYSAANVLFQGQTTMKSGTGTPTCRTL